MADVPQPFTMRVPLDRVTGVAMEPGAHFALHGRVTSMDGSALDAAQLFDFEAGGLRVTGNPVPAGAYELAATGEVASACVAAGAPTPCLVPRFEALAHERMFTMAEFASTLSGSIELESHPVAGTNVGAVLGLVALVAAVLAGLAWAFVVTSRRMTRDAMRRVRVAARRALRAIHGDPTLAAVAPSVLALVERAQHLDAVRRECAGKLLLVDREAIGRRAVALARANVPVAEAARTSLTAERAEVERLESDLASAVVELERIESALRVVALRAGDAGTRAHLLNGPDPVDALVSELEFRDEAIVEVGGR